MAATHEANLTLRAFLLLVVLALGLGAFYRLPGLERRPMHTDEAILAEKLGDFWETGRFDYDPKDFHGPALHQVSWLWGHLTGWGGPDEWTEAQLRMVAVLCGLGVILLPLLVADGLGRFGTGIAMLLTAVSPMMVYYSRYFIMEMLLVLLVGFSLACFWRFAQGGSRLWLIAGGAALGFQHATKETFVINAGATLCGLFAAHRLVGDFELRKKRVGMSLGPARKQKRPARPWLWVVIPAAIVSVLSFSGGFKDWAAVGDSVLTYLNYITRSGGSGHEKDWHYYLTLIFWRKDTWVWSEALIGGLGIIGMVNAVAGEHRSAGRRSFLLFLSVYTLALFTVYSILPYKTPWTILSAQHALTVLAGAGCGAIWSALQSRVARAVIVILLALGIYNLCDRAMLSIKAYRADARNPYAYSHTSTHLIMLLVEIDKLREERGDAMKVLAVSRDAGWPMRWYWRSMPHVTYAVDVPEAIDADVIVADADKVPAIKARLGGRPFEERKGLFGLRPNVWLRLLVAPPQTAARPASESAAAAPEQAPATEPVESIRSAIPVPSLRRPDELVPLSPPLPVLPPSVLDPSVR